MDRGDRERIAAREVAETKKKAPPRKRINPGPKIPLPRSECTASQTVVTGLSTEPKNRLVFRSYSAGQDGLFEIQRDEDEDSSPVSSVFPSQGSHPSPTTLSSSNDEREPGSVPSVTQRSISDELASPKSGKIISTFPTHDPDREAILLMHYLDHVFHTQFRFYSLSTTEGGRGWIFLLLTQTKPVYHAALSVSAHHLHVTLSLDTAAKCKRIWKDEAARYHILALKKL